MSKMCFVLQLNLFFSSNNIHRKNKTHYAALKKEKWCLSLRHWIVFFLGIWCQNALLSEAVAMQCLSWVTRDENLFFKKRNCVCWNTILWLHSLVIQHHLLKYDTNKKKLMKHSICVARNLVPRSYRPVHAKYLLCFFFLLQRTLHNSIFYFIKYSLKFQKGFIIIADANFKSKPDFASKMHSTCTEQKRRFFDKKIKCGIMQFTMK